MARPLKKPQPASPSGTLARVLRDPCSYPEFSLWKWQIRNRITTFETLGGLIELTNEEKEGFRKSKGRLAMAITPYFFNLIDRNDPDCPIRKQAIPRMEELTVSPGELVDPCGEDAHSPVPGLVHRYPDRVLLIVTDSCAMYCRYCTRNRMVGEEKPPMGGELFEEACRYIEKHEEIGDVLISGGDPLMMNTAHLEGYLKRLREIPHVELVRIGTRVPVTLPMRVDEALVRMLGKYHPLYMSIHFSHPRELTPEVESALAMLADAGIPLGSQTVLLKGVNDSPAVMKRLMRRLVRARVRPYYLYQCDPAVGTSHFRTPVSAGLGIIDGLRGHTTGYAVPTFVIDAPGGGGKIPLGADCIVSRSNGEVVIRNYEGKTFKYTEPRRR